MFSVIFFENIFALAGTLAGAIFLMYCMMPATKYMWHRGRELVVSDKPRSSLDN